MTAKAPDLAGRVALVTGAAARLGAGIVRTLHGAGARVLIHYRRSLGPAKALCGELNALRTDSCACLAADLLDLGAVRRLAHDAIDTWGQVDILVNNASSFYPTPMGSVDEGQWDDLMGSNLKGPFFLSQELALTLAQNRGVIVNLADIHGERPLSGHSVYSMAKAGVVMMTKALARELGPDVRVNAVAPGAILWPEVGLSEEERKEILRCTTLGRTGDPQDIADSVLFLVAGPGYISGQILAVDGGRSVVG